MRVRHEPFDLSHELAQAAGLRCYVDTGATLFACHDGMRLLSACRNAEVRVIGVEGFDIIDGQRRPDMTAILDLSNVEDPTDSVEDAQGFVAEVCRPGLFLEFDLERSF
ncbi:hypothetical protein OJ998_02315 [Solirubrobacter taibaiensis]|nr:hypothetical protein [Solirubrobacter taibaiensis]